MMSRQNRQMLSADVGQEKTEMNRKRPTAGWLVASLSVALVGALVLIAMFMIGAVHSMFESDGLAVDNVVSVSWGNQRETDLVLYQACVLVGSSSPSGRLSVSARVNIGGSCYYHDLGEIGTATDVLDAVKRFGVIDWEPEQVVFGGSEGQKASLSRDKLELHR
jgi:hypothetical protein